MKRSWITVSLCILIFGLTACRQQTASPTAVIITPAPSEAMEVEAATPSRDLEVVTPTPGELQPPVDSPTRLPPIDQQDMTVDTSFSISPDGAWTAQVQVAYPFDKNGVSTGSRYYTRLELLKQDGSMHWLVLDEWADWEQGYTIPTNLTWRSDSRRFYYSPQTNADGCQVFGNKRGLFEVNIEDGSVKDISGGAYGELEVSPNGAYIAILMENILTMRELASEYRVEAKLDFLKGNWRAGRLLWSPDQNSIVFTVLFNPCGPPDRSSIYSMDTHSGDLAVLVDKDDRVFVASRWLPGGTIELIDEAGAKWDLDSHTGELKKIE